MSEIITQTQQNNHAFNKDLKSRQYLSDLLDEQIDKNEFLECENFRLEEEQRKLLLLLQNRTLQLNKFKNDASRLISAPSSQVPQQAQSSPRKIRDHNDSTAIYDATSNDITTIESLASVNKTISQLNLALKEKQDELIKIRQYYMKCIEGLQKEADLNKGKIEGIGELQREIEDYRTVISKQKIRIKQLIETVEAVELQKSSQQSHQGTEKAEVLSQSLFASNQKIEALHKTIEALKEEHQTQILAVEETYEQEKQRILQQHQKQMETLHKNTIYKITQAQQKQKNDEEYFMREIEQREEENAQIKKQILGIQGQLRESMIKYEEQCEIVLAIQTGKQKLQSSLMEVQEELSLKNEQLLATTRNSFNIDNIHKQYSIQLQQKQTQIEQLKNQVSSLALELQHAQQNLSKGVSKYEEMSKKNNQRILGLENQIAKVKEEHQAGVEEIQYLQKENKLKEEDNKRLVSKISKESERKEQYVAKLEEKIRKLEGEVSESQSAMQEKEEDIGKYRDQVNNYISKLKEQISQKNKELTSVLKTLQKVQSQQSLLSQKFEQTLSQSQSRTSQLQKKLSEVSSRVQIISTEKQNYKTLYDSTLAQLQSLQSTNKSISKTNEDLCQQIDTLEREVEYLKQEILDNNLNEGEKEELKRLKDEILEHKARAIKNGENIAKMKDENNRVLRESLEMEESMNSLEMQNTKLKNQLALKSQKINELQASLSQRNSQLQSNMPYLNELLEQKHSLQLAVESRTTQIKKLSALVELAKKSKAEEILALTNQNRSYSHNIAQLQKEMRDDKEVIEHFNKQKINMLRESTMREDLIKKYEKENKQLKEDLKQSQNNCEELMSCIEATEAAMEGAKYVQKRKR